MDEGQEERGRGAVRGDDAAVLRRAAEIVWNACRSLTRDAAAARKAFDAVWATLEKHGFARLKDTGGSANPDTVIALWVRDFFAADLPNLLVRDAAEGTRVFLILFEKPLRRLIQRKMSAAKFSAARDDAYQEVCAELLADDCRRLKAYSGSGGFAGFVLRCASNLLLDYLRKIDGRRRLPAPIERLGALDQEIFRLLWWRGIGADGLGAALTTGFKPAPDAADVTAALERVRQALPAGYQPHGRQVSLDAVEEPTDDDTPETLLGKKTRDAAQDKAMEALRLAAAELSAQEKLYLSIQMSSPDLPPARDMARLMQVPVEEVYRLKQRVWKSLKEKLSDNDAIKNWLASV